MAGTLTIGTLSDGTNSTSATNCISGSAKAWVNFNGVSGSTAIRASYNVSSITYVASGNYVVNYTNAFADTNYAAVVTGRRNNSDSNYCMQFRGNSVSGAALYSTSQTAITGILANSNSLTDADIVGFAAFR